LGQLLTEEVAYARNGRCGHASRRRRLEGFNFEAPPGAARGIIEELATLTFVDRTDNLLLLGPPGVGTSHLALARGQRAGARAQGLVILGLAARNGRKTSPERINYD